MNQVVWHSSQLLILLGLAILVHETGHFLAARLAGIRVLRFSIGFPPRLFGFRVGNTDYAVSALPLGGYVRLSGEDFGESGRLKPYDLMAKPWWVRCLVYVSGVAMNLVLAFLLFFIVLAHGLDVESYPAVLDRVPAGSAAAVAGLRAGDRIVAVGGTPVEDYDELADALGKAGRGGGTADIRIRRGKEELSVGLKLAAGSDPGLNPRINPVVGTVAAGHPARKAGLRTGDRILSINGRTIEWWSDISPVLLKAKPGPVGIIVMRDGTRVAISVTPRRDAALNKPVIGISPRPMRVKVRRFSWNESGKYAAAEIGAIVGETLRTVWQVLTGRQKFRDAIGGPVMIARIGYEKAKAGIWELIHFTGALNVMLLVANLLPIPVVDGGMILLAVLEGVRQRRFSAATYGFLSNVGIAFLIGVFMLATYHDILR
jgi:regulator of sigma E protease